ncbi:neurexin-1-like isoform X1 [Argiope bruennichi]|uniref:neurexin-1-like isoform X1 n=1 Tax=Argiope bruennichi TaxID=94029 RepID=UPI002493F95B|nr:neurexin-1-like isoform X1 [Argiope bruennichi]XP_055944777.1 neurexin-1-like isoform X1 [Argiope bruennichi]
MNFSTSIGSLLFRFLVLHHLWNCFCLSFILDGSPTSFAQFPRWLAGLNGTLSLRFRTREPNGLLLYTDDGGTYDFFEVKLVEGNARLRFNLGGGTAILSAGKNLHDSQWHTLKITRNAEETILTVDSDIQKRLTAGPDYLFGNATTNSAVFIGGLPSWYGSKLSLLALPSAFFEPRFRGAVKDVVFTSDDGIQKAQELQESQGIRTASLHPQYTPNGEEVLAADDHCEKDNPCLNGGACISTDGGPICDCRATDYEGDLCEQKRPPSEATFTGEEYLHFDVRGSGGEPLVSWSDQVSLQFRSRQSAGLLFFAADMGIHGTGTEDFLHVSLKGGGIAVHTKLGSGHVEKVVRPSKVRFDDNQWHKIVIHRKVREITRATGFCHLSVTIDGVYTERGSTAGSFSMLSSSVIYVGGLAPTTAAQLLPASRVRNNFIGCVRKVEFIADSVSLDLLSLAKSQSKLLRYHGDVQFFCQEMEAADPITFTTRESFLALPTWEGSKTGSVAFRFRTNEATGLLMYNGGQGDVFALELLDGHVYLILGLGSGIAKVKASAKRCDEGQWHTVTLRRTGKSGRIAVDEAAYDFTTPGTASQLDLEGPLFVGALAPSDQGPNVPSEVWTAKLNYGYVGCLRQLVINGKTIDLAAQAREQDSGSLRPSCHTSPSQCDSQPCLNGGLCSEGWNRFICDCTRTGFTGPVCAKDASTLSFDGSQYLKIDIPEGSKTQAEDVQLRFRTPRPGGLLLATTSEKASTFLVLGIENGKLKIVINLGDKDKVIDLGQSLNDDTWHTVHIRRRGHKMDVHLDSDSKSYDLGEVDSMTLDIQTLHVGSIHPEHLKHIASMPNFVGHLQHLIFNRKHYLDMAHSGQISHFKVTAKFGKKDNIVHHPVTFKSKFTFLGLPQLRAYSTLNLYFQFKTMEPNGLVLYNAGKGQDFIAVELVDGHLHYVFNLGDGPRGVRSNTKTALNDNQWHAVTIGRPSLHQHTLMVDDMITKVSSPGPNTHLDLQGLLYVGGVRRSMYGTLPRLLHSRQGFQGCLASLDLNGETGDLIRDALIPSTLVARGCAGSMTKCSHSACANHGVCVQVFNSYTCDCDMTSFSGPICADESISYEFGPGTGLITLTFPPDKMPDTKTDLVALGFITMADNGVLVRIDSGTSNDYMELEIVDGNIYMVYNMGTEDHPIGEHSVHVNDGQYHVVRFTRSGPNSTIQVDDHNVRTKQPPGRQLTVFNSHSTIQVGGKKNPLRGGIERPFQGIISGLVVNGDRILDMAAEDDPRISVQGDVELLMSLPLSLQQRSVPSDHQMQQHAGASPNYEGDDLVYSGGGGSGCWDDEDDCGEQESTSGRSRDDLITPVYIPPTPRPYPRTTPSINGGGGGYIHSRSSAPPRHHAIGGLEDTTCDDEEDCIEGGSGLGEVSFTINQNTPATPAFITTTSTHQEVSENFANPPRVIPPPTHDADAIQRIVITPPSVPSTTLYRRPPPEEVIVTQYRPPAPPPPLYPVIPQQTPRPQLRPSTRSPPTMQIVPIPDLPVTGRESNKPPPKIKTSSAADNTAMVIGIIAGVLIVVVIVALVVYRVRSWTLAASPAGGYKVDETAKRYHFPPAGTAPYQSQPPSAQHMNGALKCDPAQNKMVKQPKKKDVKDLKEWYV